MRVIKVHPTFYAIVDDEDYGRLAVYHWNAHYSKSKGIIYAQACVNGRNDFMHRMVMKAKKGERVDHKTHNQLDNRKENLRLCTNQQNSFNRRINSNNRSGFKGVAYDPCYGAGGRKCGRKVWRAEAEIGGKRHFLGKYGTPEEAHEAYKAFVKAHHGEFYNDVDISRRGGPFQ